MAVTATDSCVSGTGTNGVRNSGNCSMWPPGFRFHPTDEELVLYYLKRKICKRKLNFGIIREIDVYKWDPEELPGQSLLKTGDRQWFFFSPRDRKYPNGGRSNRATRQGYWKATGKDRNIACNSRNVGVKKTLVFYRGRAPSGARTDWVMHEYTMDEDELSKCHNVQDYYALYKVFKKSGPGPKNGEQYGAPFKEEEWTDGDFADSSECTTAYNSAKDLSVSTFSDEKKISLPVQESEDELSELLKQFVDGPELYFEPLCNGGCVESQHIVNGMEDSTLTEVSLPELNIEEISLDMGQTIASTSLLNWGANETSSGNANSELNVEDFLEIDDLVGVQPAFPHIEEFGNSSLPNGGDVFTNMCNESDLLLNEDLLLDPKLIYPEDELDDLGNYQSSRCPVEDQTSNLNKQFLSESAVNNHICEQFGLNDQEIGDLPSANTKEELCLSYPQGVSNDIFGSSSTNYQNSVVQSTSSNGFTSSIWSFLESIPSTPASASESHLMSRTLERMSSFSRLRANVSKNSVVNPKDDGLANMRKKVGLSRQFLILSVIGALCAILWIAVNGMVKWSGRSIFS